MVTDYESHHSYMAFAILSPFCREITRQWIFFMTVLARSNLAEDDKGDN